MTAPSLTSNHGVYNVEFLEQRVKMEFRRVWESHREVSADIITYRTTDFADIRLYTGYCSNLLGPRTQTDYAKKLEPTVQGEPIPWQQLVDSAFPAVVEAHRTGAKPTYLRDAIKRPNSGWIVKPILHGGKRPVMLFGPRSSLKTYLASGLIASSHLYLDDMIGLEPQVQMKWGILDGELEAFDHQQRMYRMLGPGTDLKDISHLPTQGRPLVDNVERVGNWIADEQIEGLLVDSVGVMCKGSPSNDEAAIGFMQAWQSLEVDGLLIAHINKSDDANSKIEPFGSIFWGASMGSTFYVDAPPVERRKPNLPFVITLINRKPSDFGPVPNLSFSVLFTEDGRTQIKPCATPQRAAEDPDASSYEKVRASVQIGRRTYDEIAAVCGIKVDAVRKLVERYPNTFVTDWGVDSGGKRKMVGLKDHRKEFGSEEGSWLSVSATAHEES
jgi:hypothetical protein